MHTNLNASAEKLTQLRTALIRSGISDTARTDAPTNTPVTPAQVDLDARGPAVAEPFEARKPVAKVSTASSGSVFSLQTQELSKRTAPPPPPPPPPAATQTRRRATPAEVLALPANASKTPSEQMKLFAPRALHGTIDRVQNHPVFQQMFARLAANPPANIAGVLVHTVGVQALHDNAETIAKAVTTGTIRGERAASRYAGYMVHPHNYCKDADTVAAKTDALQRSFGQQLEYGLGFFAQADASGDAAAFFASCPAPGGASCHAVRMNSIIQGLGQFRQRDPLLSDAVGDTDPTVLRRAYELVADDPTMANLRTRLARHGVSASRIDAIAASYAGTLD